MDTSVATMIGKDASEAIKVVFDFTDLLTGSDAISGTATIAIYDSATGLASSGLTVGTPTLSSPRVTAVVSGGTLGKVYVLKCSATATGGQTLVVDVGVSIFP